MNKNGLYYCPKCKKLVKGRTIGGSGVNGTIYYEVSCEDCGEILDED